MPPTFQLISPTDGHQISPKISSHGQCPTGTAAGEGSLDSHDFELLWSHLPTLVHTAREKGQRHSCACQRGTQHHLHTRYCILYGQIKGN